MHVVELNKAVPRLVVRLLDERGVDIAELIEPSPGSIAVNGSDSRER